MCGRFVSASPPDDIARYFGAEQPERRLEERYNVAPTNEVYAVRAAGGRRALVLLRWGLVPFWAKEPKVGARMINARAESVADKPAFRQALRRRRCLVPADGFYEWATVPGHRTKQPYYIHRPDGEPLAFAGLWERWRAPEADPEQPALETCTILTCEANATMAPIHDRMPVLLPPTRWDQWLSPGSGDNGPDDATLAELRGLLVPAPEHLLVAQPVTTAVNRVGNDGPALIEPDPDPLVAT